MTNIVANDFSKPDEKMTFDKAEANIVYLGDVKVTKAFLQPGWSWSTCIKPVVGTESCQAKHVGVVIQGSVSAKHDDGTEVQFKAGDAYVIEPGHDGWVEGNEVAVIYEFSGNTPWNVASST